MSRKLGRRTVVKGLLGAAAGTSVSMPWVGRWGALASEPIVLAVPTAQTALAGVADHLDHLHGTQLAMEEINAAGGIHGRQLKLFVVDVDPLSPESCKQAM